MRNGNSYQYSCLENSKDREAWRATVWEGGLADLCGHFYLNQQQQQHTLEAQVATPLMMSFSLMCQRFHLGELGKGRQLQRNLN